MSLIATTLASACIGLTGNQLDACNKAVEAGVKQSGLEAISNNAEDKVNIMTQKVVKDHVNDDIISISGSIIYISKAVQTQSISVNIPTAGLCSTASAQINASNSNIKLEWKF